MNTSNNTNQIKRIADSLLYAYHIKPNALVSDNLYVKRRTHQEDTEQWVKQMLLNPDDKLAECILPILVDRFNQHLKNKEA